MDCDQPRLVCFVVMMIKYALFRNQHLQQPYWFTLNIDFGTSLFSVWKSWLMGQCHMMQVLLIIMKIRCICFQATTLHVYIILSCACCEVLIVY